MGHLGPAPGRNVPLLRLSALAVLAPLAALALQGPVPEAPSFRVDVKLVNVLATVKDARGGTIGGLERDDFTVLAAGVPQQIAIFERQTDRRLSVVMLFDVSPSVAKERKFEQEAALRFLRALLGTGSNPADRVAVHRFSDFVDEAQAFTSSLARLEKAVTSSHRRGGTSVYDALYLAAHTLEKRQGRKVMDAP